MKWEIYEKNGLPGGLVWQHVRPRELEMEGGAERIWPERGKVDERPTGEEKNDASVAATHWL